MRRDKLVAHTAAYGSEADARSDLGAFQRLTSEEVVGAYDTAIVTKQPNGKVLVDKHDIPTVAGGVIGASLGAMVGYWFPPTIWMTTIVGGAAGAVAGKLWGRRSRSMFVGVDEILDVGQSGVVIVGEANLDEYIEQSLTHALRRVRREL